MVRGRTHTAVEEGEGRSWGAPPMTAPAPARSAFRRANSKESTSSTNVNDSGSTEFRSRTTSVAVESPTDDESSTTDHDELDATEYQEIDEEIVPESSRVRRVDVESVMGEVKDDWH